MPLVEYRNIEKVPGVCGGRAVIAGTRLRVSLISSLQRDGMTVDQIIEQYPHLRPSNVHDALAYAYDHPTEIEKDLADDDEKEVMKQFPGGQRTS